MSRPATAAGLAAWTCVFAAQVAAQSLDSTLDQIIDDDITEQVEQELAETIEEQVEEQVESDVAETIEQQIEDNVEETIESQVEAGITETIESHVEAGITDTIENQVEAGVGQIVELELESAIEDALDDSLDAVDGDGATLEDIVESLDDVVQAADDALETPETSESPEGESEARSRTERFVPAVDDVGRTVEAEIWVVLVPSEYADRIPGWGLTVRERQDLDALDRVLLRVDAPEDSDIVEAALELALDAPGTLVDYNHVYEPSDETAVGAARVERPLSLTTPRPPVETALAIGIIDSAVAGAHIALSSAAIVQQDFVPFDGIRPVQHGTAVASILVGQSDAVRASLPAARLYAASVFFEDAEGREAATTASLVAALDWLSGTEPVRVINMSLAGPANVVLEAAINAVAGQGLIVVAAVGNNGPAGGPLYPAAYDAVVGVTAVDSTNRIYHYANRGRHVMFSAPGVDIAVAASAGGFRTLSGTSMAAPHAAAIIADAMAAGAESAQDVLARLKSHAVDLGEKDFDDVFGFGLIAVE